VVRSCRKISVIFSALCTRFWYADCGRWCTGPHRSNERRSPAAELVRGRWVGWQVLRSVVGMPVGGSVFVGAGGNCCSAARVTTAGTHAARIIFIHSL